MIVRDILSAVRRRWWVLLGCVVIGLAAAGVSAVLSADNYSSSARLLVATPDINPLSPLPPGNLTPQEVATNYAALATGSKIPQQVIDQLGLTDPLPQVLKQVKVSVVGTSIIQVTVTDPDAAQAQRIAQAFATDLADYARTISQQSGASDTAATITVTDPANLPQVPVASGGLVSDLALGLIAGIVVGAALIWLLEFLDRRIHQPEELRDASESAVLGTVGAEPKDGSAELLAAGAGSDADSYRTLRTALQFVPVAHTTPAFVIAPAGPGTDSPAVAASLAHSIAQAGQRTLLMDADLHSPALGQLLGLTGSAGLAEALAGDVAVADVVQPWPGTTVDVLTAGNPPSLPTEQAQSKAMDALLGKLRGQYDVIILSTPPLSEVTDGALLATAGDGAVLVARSGRTTVDEIRVAAGRLAIVHAALLGSVLVGASRGGVQLPYLPPALSTGADRDDGGA